MAEDIRAMIKSRREDPRGHSVQYFEGRSIAKAALEIDPDPDTEGDEIMITDGASEDDDLEEFAEAVSELVEEFAKENGEEEALELIDYLMNMPEEDLEEILNALQGGTDDFEMDEEDDGIPEATTEEIEKAVSMRKSAGSDLSFLDAISMARFGLPYGISASVMKSIRKAEEEKKNEKDASVNTVNPPKEGSEKEKKETGEKNTDTTASSEVAGQPAAAPAPVVEETPAEEKAPAEKKDEEAPAEKNEEKAPAEKKNEDGTPTGETSAEEKAPAEETPAEENNEGEQPAEGAAQDQPQQPTEEELAYKAMIDGVLGAGSPETAQEVPAPVSQLDFGDYLGSEYEQAVRDRATREYAGKKNLKRYKDYLMGVNGIESGWGHFWNNRLRGGLSKEAYNDYKDKMARMNEYMRLNPQMARRFQDYQNRLRNEGRMRYYNAVQSDMGLPEVTYDQYTAMNGRGAAPAPTAQAAARPRAAAGNGGFNRALLSNPAFWNYLNRSRTPQEVQSFLNAIFGIATPPARRSA